MVGLGYRLKAFHWDKFQRLPEVGPAVGTESWREELPCAGHGGLRGHPRGSGSACSQRTAGDPGNCWEAESLSGLFGRTSQLCCYGEKSKAGSVLCSDVRKGGSMNVYLCLYFQKKQQEGEPKHEGSLCTGKLEGWERLTRHTLSRWHGWGGFPGVQPLTLGRGGHHSGGPCSGETCPLPEALAPAQPGESYAFWSWQSWDLLASATGSGHTGAVHVGFPAGTEHQTAVFQYGTATLSLLAGRLQDSHGVKGHSSHLKVGPSLKTQRISSIAFLKLKIKVRPNIS